MKKTYVVPELEIVMMNELDVITESTGTGLPWDEDLNRTNGSFGD